MCRGGGIQRLSKLPKVTLIQKFKVLRTCNEGAGEGVSGAGDRKRLGQRGLQASALREGCDLTHVFLAPLWPLLLGSDVDWGWGGG